MFILYLKHGEYLISPEVSVHGPQGLLQGFVAGSHCGNRLQSDRHYQRVPLYRERHAHECSTNESSIVASVIDKQVAILVHSLEIKPDWKQQMAEIDHQIAQTTVVTPPAIEDTVELFSNLPMLWSEATTEEKRVLLKSLVELVYVDIKTKTVTGIKPTLAFRALYGVGIHAGPDTPVRLMFRGETPILVEMVETGES